MFTYFHNPKCSKSRKGLELLKERNIDFEIREYLKSPLGENEISLLIEKSGLPGKDFVRKKESLYKELQVNETGMDLNDWSKLLAENPSLLERPILESSSKSVIGRPTENLLELLQTSD